MMTRSRLGNCLALIVIGSTLSSAAASAACSLAIDEAGLAGITADTRFDIAAIAQAVPGCQVAPGTDWTEGDPIDVLAIRDGQRKLALVFPDWNGTIYSIVVDDTGVLNRLGPALGATFATVYGARSPPICVPGVEEASGQVLCQAQPGGHLVYVFEGRWDGPDDAVPPAPVLSSWRLGSLVWRAAPLEDPRWVDAAGFDPGEGPALLDQVQRAIDDPDRLSRLVLYPIVLRATADGRTGEIAIPDAATFIREYARRLTPAFAAAVRNEPSHALRIDGDGVDLAGGRVRIAVVCVPADCVQHRSGIVAVSMF